MAVFVLLVCIILPLVSAQPPHDKRNVLLIIADDVGFETSVYNHTACKMPNLARLAQQSVTVRNAYTSVSSCSPSRSVILTGMPQHQNGMYGLHHQENHFMSFDTVKSLPLLLKPYGIHTGMIGKKHVGPKYVYKFDFERDSDTLNMLQCARNITQMKLYVREFFAQQNNTTPFMLYMGFNDAHRCGGQYGEFCEKFGNGEKGMGVIDDWKPVYYDPKDVEVPYFLPDTLTTRIDIAKQYTSLSRLDAGISMLLAELERVGHLNDTLIVYTADNGIPFPNAKTNLFEPGMGEPMLISNPFDKQRWGQVSDAMTSTMDIVPTVLDWFGIPMPGEEEETTKPIPKTKEFPTPDETIKRPSAALTGHSMMPITESEPGTGWDHVYASHNFHEVTMYYPMRVLRNRRYRLIHNLNNRAPYPLATDLYACPTFLEILNNTVSGKPTNWFKTLEDYYYRDEWELYDLQNDPHELINLADDPDHQEVRQNMTTQLHSWMMETADTWHCYPHGVRFGPDSGCGPMYNEPTQRGSPEINIIH